MRKKNNIRNKKKLSFQLNLSSKDSVLLQRYCLVHKTGQKTATKKILHDFLVNNVTLPTKVSKDQLTLFERQTDLYDFIDEER